MQQSTKKHHSSGDKLSISGLAEKHTSLLFFPTQNEGVSLRSSIAISTKDSNNPLVKSAFEMKSEKASESV